MSNSDDWFEQALRELDEEDEEDADGDDSLSEAGFDIEPEPGEPEADTAADPTPDPAGDSAPADDEEGGLFEQDFAAALSDAPGESGGQQPEESTSEPLPDEDPDSDIDRIDLGIEGLDQMIQGGVPRRSLMVTIGSPGSGKTTFGLQFLNHGLKQGNAAVYITLEETQQRVIRSATEKGMPFDEYMDAGKLAVVDFDATDMAHSLRTIQSELVELINEFGATRLVLDSVSLLEMMFESRTVRRNEIYDFTQKLKAAGVTTMLTSEASDDNPYVSRYGIVEYLTDAVFILQYVRPDDFQETRTAVEIQKIRDAYHSREKKPYEISDEGISVYRQATLF